MAAKKQLHTVFSVLPGGGSSTFVIDLRFVVPVALQLPDGWTTSHLTFQVGFDVGALSDFGWLAAGSGRIISIFPALAGYRYLVSHSWFDCIDALIIRSGHPEIGFVTQPDQRLIRLLCIDRFAPET